MIDPVRGTRDSDRNSGLAHLIHLTRSGRPSLAESRAPILRIPWERESLALTPRSVWALPSAMTTGTRRVPLALASSREARSIRSGPIVSCRRSSWQSAGSASLPAPRSSRRPGRSASRTGHRRGRPTSRGARRSSRDGRLRPASCSAGARPGGHRFCDAVWSSPIASSAAARISSAPRLAAWSRFSAVGCTFESRQDGVALGPGLGIRPISRSSRANWARSRTGSVLSRLPSAALWTAARRSVTSSVRSSRRQSVRTPSSFVVFARAGRSARRSGPARGGTGTPAVAWPDRGRPGRGPRLRPAAPGSAVKQLQPAHHHADDLAWAAGAIVIGMNASVHDCGRTNKTRTPSVWK